VGPPPGLCRALEFIDSWLEYRHRQLDVPGFAVAIHRGEETRFSRAYGLADVERQELLTVTHRLAIGSQSKMFTATALVQLAERGMLTLDDRVVTHLPWLAGHPDARFASVTLRQLLSHGAGVIRDGLDADFWQLTQPFPDASAFHDAVLAADLVIDGYTKLKYSDQVAAGVIAPAGIDAVIDSEIVRAGPLARGYTRKIDRRRLPVPREVVTSSFAPSAGWYATVDDMCRFVSGLLSNSDGVLGVTAKDEMRRSRRGHWVPAHQRGSEYGLGMEIHRFGGRVLLGHGGSITGFRSCTFGDPGDGLVVAVMANAKDAPTMQMLGGIFEVIDFFQEHASKPATGKLSAGPMRFVGLASTIELVAAGQRVVAIDPDQWFPFHDADELLPLTDTTFRIDRASDLAATGETAELLVDGAEATAMTFGGSTMWREDAYLAWLASRDEVVDSPSPRSTRTEVVLRGIPEATRRGDQGPPL